MLWILAVASVLVGNVVALQQTDLRRLLAWSSIAHAGYMLIGLIVAMGAGRGGMEALLFYLAAYAAMTVGAFAILIALRHRPKPIATIEDLSGLARIHPLLALAMTVFLLSLIGLPPTAGFLGKLNLLLTAWSAQTPMPHVPDARWLAVLLIVGAAIGAWYYLRLIGAMYLGEPEPGSRESAGPLDVPAAIGVACCVLVTVALFAAPSILWPLIERLNGSLGS
jgi:NADH-quinone oxidoreductase subunit N